MNIAMPNVTVSISTMLLGVLLASAAPGKSFGDLSLVQLEQRQDEIKTQLANLANYSLGGGIGAIGYRSQSHETPDYPESVEVDLKGEFALDEIMLVPAIRRDVMSGFQADGFPRQFRIVVGNNLETNGVVVASFKPEDGVLPRIAPLIVPCHGMKAYWIRVEAESLNQRAFDGQYVFQLAELLAFSGSENVALHQPVHATSSGIGYGWGENYLVDGFMPYLMDAANGSQSVAFITSTALGKKPTLTVDLGASLPISRIHLHAVDQSDMVPQAFAGDIGIPTWLRIEGANRADFSDAKVLADLHHRTIYDVGPIMMFSFPKTNCRFVRAAVMEPYVPTLYGQFPDRLGFAEIEIFSGGQNVALHKPVTASFNSENSIRRLSNITDGLNMFGELLPVQDWLKQLAQRHELEKARPLLSAELNQRYARQKAVIQGMVYLTILLAFGAVVIVFVDRLMRQRAIEQTRKRIAADLHDELGAALHAIGLLSDLANNSRSAPEKLGGILDRMRTLTERTAKAARYCTNLLEAKGLYGDLATDMRRTTVRLLAGLEYDLKFEGEETLQRLKPRERIDLLLLYQECLTNIIRHSGATRARISLSVTHGEMLLNISDNGGGIHGQTPGSLKRRARLLGAQVQIGRSELNGASVSLRMKLGRFGLFK
jgi:signal transduction histidine kinase